MEIAFIFYIMGLIIVSVAMGHIVSMLSGFMVFGSGLLILSVVIFVVVYLKT